MADILIKGMEMPESCGVCKLRTSVGCAPMSETKVRIGTGKREKWCPLVEVPTPHGRPVRRGKWIDVGECNLETIWQCSECGFKQVGQAWIGCPKCLADMREEHDT